tara:strand:+ start:125 stop:1153 length:1029 start_codon:yes stop_codon:yes gene_type:complete
MRFFLYQIIIVTVTFIGFEIFLKIKYSKMKNYSCYKTVEETPYYTNGINCNEEIYYFEKKNPTLYATNHKGQRIGKNVNEKDKIEKLNKVFFIGDSFTFGHLSNYENSYPYNSIVELNKLIGDKKYKEINMGVNGYQFRDNLNIIKKVLNKKLDSYIVYGLTPNDLFDLVKNNKNQNQNQNKSNIDKIKKIVDDLNILSIKYLNSLILKNDKIYSFLHSNRGDKAGYVNSKSSLFWEEKYKIFYEEISTIPKELRKKVIFTIIPQQIQIKKIKINKVDDGLAFDNKILKICEKIKIKCISFTEELGNKFNFQTHFPLDGHLLPKVNKMYGNILGEHLYNIIH